MKTLSAIALGTALFLTSSVARAVPPPPPFALFIDFKKVDGALFYTTVAPFFGRGEVREVIENGSWPDSEMCIGTFDSHPIFEMADLFDAAVPTLCLEVAQSCAKGSPRFKLQPWGC